MDYQISCGSRFKTQLYLLCILFSILSSVEVHAIELQDGKAESFSDNGRIKISWTASEAEAPFLLQRAMTADFQNPETIYEGMDRASFVSGLADGEYYFRVRNSLGRFSSVLLLKVRHFSLSFALIMFVLGFIVFLATAFVVIKGSCRYSKEPEVDF